MFGPISENTAVRMVSAVGNKNSDNPAAKGKEEANFSAAGLDRNTTGNAGVHKNVETVPLSEVRKSEVTDGEIKTRVYDRSGKLLRVIPPGYLPAGEQKFDVTI